MKQPQILFMLQCAIQPTRSPVGGTNLEDWAKDLVVSGHIEIANVIGDEAIYYLLSDGGKKYLQMLERVPLPERRWEVPPYPWNNQA